MHVLAAELASLDEVDVAVDLGQSPAEVVVLSFSDTDLSALAAAWLMVAVLNHEPWRSERSSVRGKGAADTREVVLALRESRRQLMDLIEPTAVERAPAPTKQAPRPRSKFVSPRRPV